MSEEINTTDRKVKFGRGEYEVEVPVYAQSIPYLRKRLGKILSGFLESDRELNLDNFIEFLGDGVYDVLAGAIGPKFTERVPPHRWAGYLNEGDYNAGSEVPEDNPGPTPPQVMDAFKAIWEVNRFDRLGDLGKLLPQFLDTNALKARIRLETTRAITQASWNSPPASGEEPSTSGGTDQTPTENGGSPSPDGDSSQERTLSVVTENSETSE